MKTLFALLLLSLTNLAQADQYIRTDSGRIVITDQVCIPNEYGANQSAYITGDDKVHKACWYKKDGKVTIWFYDEPEPFAIPYPYYLFMDKQ